MENKKKWYQSKTILSNLLIVILATAGAIDAQFGTGILNNKIIAIVLSILGTIGIKGRLNAKTEIK